MYLDTLFLAALPWASVGSTPAVAPPPANREATALNNGNVITIGVAAAMSGPADGLGWPQANAVQLVISQTNAAGGVEIGGIAYTLTVVTADSACNGTQAIAAANTLLNAGAVAVVGHTCSSASFPAQATYNAASVPMISPSSSYPGVTERGYTTTFRVHPRDDSQAVLMATYFSQSLGIDAVALVEWNDDAISIDTFSSTFTSLHTVGSTDDFTATLTAIQPENPDAIFYADLDANHAGFLSHVAGSVTKISQN